MDETDGDGNLVHKDNKDKQSWCHKDWKERSYELAWCPVIYL